MLKRLQLTPRVYTQQDDQGKREKSGGPLLHRKAHGIAVRCGTRGYSCSADDRIGSDQRIRTELVGPGGRAFAARGGRLCRGAPIRSRHRERDARPDYRSASIQNHSRERNRTLARVAGGRNRKRYCHARCAHHGHVCGAGTDIRAVGAIDGVRVYSVGAWRRAGRAGLGHADRCALSRAKTHCGGRVAGRPARRLARP